MNKFNDQLSSVYIIKETERFVRNLLATSLPQHMYFHGLQHTQYVVNAATGIGFFSGVSVDEMIILQTAAWLHDVGYCFTYNGHEEKSVDIASTFLSQLQVPGNFIDEVTNCILATRMPQSPTSQLQQIICDADLTHLADEDYLQISERLRMEWEFKLGKKFTPGAWRESNLNLLSKHNYFTAYGIKVLEASKQRNIERLKTQK